MADLRVRGPGGLVRRGVWHVKVEYRAVESPIAKGKAAGEGESKK